MRDVVRYRSSAVAKDPDEHRTSSRLGLAPGFDALHRTDAIDGPINDNQNRVYQPQVAVYLDNIFGGMMPVDPDAPPVPCKPQPICTEVAPLGPLPVSAR